MHSGVLGIRTTTGIVGARTLKWPTPVAGVPELRDVCLALHVCWTVGKEEDSSELWGCQWQDRKNALCRNTLDKWPPSSQALESSTPLFWTTHAMSQQTPGRSGPALLLGAKQPYLMSLFHIAALNLVGFFFIFCLSIFNQCNMYI